MAERFIPQYVADRVLGSGAHGTVYLVHNQRAENFALKVWKSRDPEPLSRLQSEVKVLARLSHPNLVRFDAFLPEVAEVKGVAEKGAGILMEWIEGEELTPKSPGDFSEIQEYFVQALRALNYLHQRHLFHGDLKPSNLRATAKGKLKVLDFSLAARVEDRLAAGEVAGTWDYLAPEAFRGERGERSDLFSLGLIVYEWLAGKKPFDVHLDVQHHFAALPEPLASLNKKVPAYFSDITLRLLALDPGRRFSSARAVIRALNRGVEKPFALGTEAEASATVPFIGRGGILHRFENECFEWSEGRRRSPIFLLHGPGGSGKTRLAGELARLALMRGLKVREMSRQEWAQLRPEALGNEKTLLIGDRLETLDAAEWRQLLAHLRDLKVRAPDVGSLLIYNDRELPLPLPPAELTQEIALSGLEPEESTELLQEYFEDVSDRESSAGYALSAGNPSLLIALAEAAKRTELKSWDPEDGAWEKFVLPVSVAADQDRNWVSLPEPARETLIALVLLGDTYSAETLANLLGRKPEVIREVLASLQGTHYVSAADDDYRFQPALFRADLLKRFGAEAGQKLRARLFSALQAQRLGSARVLSELAAALGEREALIRYATQAAEQSVAAGKIERGIAGFREVLQNAPDDEPAAYVWAHLAAAYGRLARFEEALEAYKNWFDRTRDDGSGVQAVKYHYLVANLLANHGKQKKARELLEKALELCDAERFPQHLPFQLKAYALKGKLLEQAADIAAAEQAYRDGLALARGDSIERVQLLRNLGQFLMSRGQSGAGREALTSALNLSRQLAYQEGMVNAAFLLAHHAQREGRLPEALELYGECLEIANAQRDPVKTGRTHSNLAAVLIEMGDYGRAEEQAIKAEALLSIHGNPSDRALNHFHLETIRTYLAQEETALRDGEHQASDLGAYHSRLTGEACRLRRDYQGALQAYQRSASRFTELKQLEESDASRLLQAYTETLAGDPDAALRCLQAWRSSVHPLACFHEFLKTALAWSSPTGEAEVRAAADAILARAEPEWVMLACRGVAELLQRRGDTVAAEWLKSQANEWLEGMYRSLPEDMQLSFEHREDFQKLAESQRLKLKSSGLSRERFAVFARINQRLNESDALPSVLEQVMDAAMALAGADRGFLLIAEAPHGGQIIPGFRVEAARNLKKENVSDEEFKVSLSVIQEALRRRVTLVTDNAGTDPKFKHAESVHLYGLKSILVLPLLSEKECLGVLYLDHRFAIGAFSEEALLFLKAFADQSVLAIEKTRMLAALAKSNQKLKKDVADQSHRIEKMEIELLEARKHLRFGYEEIIGHSPRMIQTLQMLDRITDTRIPVWIHGESGTGKELIARALHFNSDRKAKPFIAENCSAIPENLLESVLFGHVRGAFTHAEKDKMGLFEAANGGTIFLDEIGDMPMPMQAKLLRVLQESEVKRVGSNQSVPIDVRVVSATNKDLPAMVKRGEFREDLFFRLNGIRVHLAPLRERKEDIPLLAQHFVNKVAEENGLKPCGFADDALKTLAAYQWPGNIRELENAMRNAVIFADGRVITADALGFKPELFAPSRVAESAVADRAPRVIEGVAREREAILDAMARAGFHKGQAAKELKVTARHLYNLLEKYQLPKNKWALKKLVEEERGAIG